MTEPKDTAVSGSAEAYKQRFQDTVTVVDGAAGEICLEVSPEHFHEVALALRDEPEFAFEQLIDLCGVDYLTYGKAEWTTQESTDSGFSRGVERNDVIAQMSGEFPERRFAVVYHLLSVSRNKRLRLRVFTGTANPPIVPSALPIWAAANWFEREAFDLFGILFDGHPDLRRILTDYGFLGHPFRKDFPISGNVEVRYDPEKSRVVYQPVSIESRTLVPKVIRDDHRYAAQLSDGPDNG